VVFVPTLAVAVMSTSALACHHAPRTPAAFPSADVAGVDGGGVDSCLVTMSSVLNQTTHRRRRHWPHRLRNRLIQTCLHHRRATAATAATAAR